MCKTIIVLLAMSVAAGLAGGCGNQQPASSLGGSLATQPASAEKATKSAPEAAGRGILGAFQSIGDRALSFFENLGGNTPLYYAKLTQSDNPDLRRAGINGLVKNDAGRGPTYTALYRKLAAQDPDYLVRAQALRALNQSRDKESTDLFIKALADPNLLVRLEGAKGLNRVPVPDAARPLLELVNKPDENKDVRIAAAEALRHYKTLEVARSLVAQLSSRDFGLAFQSRRSLKRLTNRDLLYDEAAWLAYLTGPDKPFG